MAVDGTALFVFGGIARGNEGDVVPLPRVRPHRVSTSDTPTHSLCLSPCLSLGSAACPLVVCLA